MECLNFYHVWDDAGHDANLHGVVAHDTAANGAHDGSADCTCCVQRSYFYSYLFKQINKQYSDIIISTTSVK